MQVRLVRTLVAIALAGALGQGCGPSVSTPVVPPTPMQRDPRCAGFELDVAHVWNQQTRGEIKTAFGRVGGGYSKQVVARVITKMDNITRDWVMLKENLCTDCLVRGLISKDIYATRSACYDASLIRQRMLIEYLKNADQKTVDHSLAVFGSVLDNLLQCQSEAISTSATASAANAPETPPAVTEVDKMIIESEISQRLGKLERSAELIAKAEEQVGRLGETSGSAENAKIHLNKGTLDREYAKYDESIANLEQAYQMFQEARYPIGIAEALKELGTTYTQQSNYNKALLYFSNAEQQYKSVLGEQSRELAHLRIRKAEALHLSGKSNNAVFLARNAIKTLEHDAEQNRLLIAEGYAVQAQALIGVSQFKKALSAAARSLELRKREFGDSHPVTAEAIGIVALACAELGQWDRAVQNHLWQVQTLEKAYGAEGAAVARYHLGDDYLHMERFEEAAQQFQVSLDAKSLPPLYTAHNYVGLGQALSKQGKHGEAIQYFKQALPIYQKVQNVPTGQYVTLWSLGIAWGKKGDIRKELDYYDKAVFFAEKVYGNQSFEVGELLHFIGNAWFKLRKYRKACRYYERSLEMKGKSLDPRHPDYLVTLEQVNNCKKR